MKELKYPYIVLCGFCHCGKSYSASLIKNDLNISVNINKYDFITRLLMYFFEINPISVDYNQISDNYLDYFLMNENVRKCDYVKNTVTLYKSLTKENIIYIVKNIFNKNNNFEFVTDSYINKLIELSKILYINRKTCDKKLLFNITSEFYNKIINEVYDFSNKYDVYEYLNIMLKPYNNIQKYGKRIIYYAYSVNEAQYFKEKYCAPVIYIDMEHNIRTNLLAAAKETEKLLLTQNSNYIKEMEQLKKLSTAVVINNYDFKTTIANKIKNAIKI